MDQAEAISLKYRCPADGKEYEIKDINELEGDVYQDTPYMGQDVPRFFVYFYHGPCGHDHSIKGLNWGL